jgi:hypothetical protein
LNFFLTSGPWWLQGPPKNYRGVISRDGWWDAVFVKNGKVTSLLIANINNSLGTSSVFAKCTGTSGPNRCRSGRFPAVNCTSSPCRGSPSPLYKGKETPLVVIRWQELFKRVDKKFGRLLIRSLTRKENEKLLLFVLNGRPYEL